MSESKRAHWTPATIGEIAKRFLSGGTPSTEVQSFWTGSIPWITGADFAEFGIGEFRRFVSDAAVQQTATDVVREGELLIVTRTGVGKLAIAPCDIAISQDITGLYPDRDRVDVRFLFHRMKLGVEALKRLNQGTSINGIIRDDLLSYPFDLPPMLEQQFIAEVLSTLDEAIQHTEALIAKMQQVKAGLMHDLFTRGILPNGELRPPREEAPQLYKESPLGWIPKEWAIARVDNCGSVKLGRQRSPDQHSGNWSSPYLRVANVFDGYIDFTDILEMDFTPMERITFSVLAGDILLNEGQSLELVGRCSLYQGHNHQFCFQNTLVRFRASSGHTPSFYRWLFKLCLDSGRFKAIAKQTTSVAHLGADRFARMLVPSLSPDEQGLIADRLNAEQRLIDVESARMKKLHDLKFGLMHDLLTGRVRIPESMLKGMAART